MPKQNDHVVEFHLNAGIRFIEANKDKGCFNPGEAERGIEQLRQKIVERRSLATGHVPEENLMAYDSQSLLLFYAGRCIE